MTFFPFPSRRIPMIRLSFHSHFSRHSNSHSRWQPKQSACAFVHSENQNIYSHYSGFAASAVPLAPFAASMVPLQQSRLRRSLLAPMALEPSPSTLVRAYTVSGDSYVAYLLMYFQLMAGVRWLVVRGAFLLVRYDTRCYFNVRSKADISQLNLPHGTDN